MLPKMYPRLFTVEEANALLADLKPLMERASQRIEILRRRSRSAVRRDELDPESGDFMEKLRQDEGVAQAIKELHELVQQIIRAYETFQPRAERRGEGHGGGTPSDGTGT